MDKFKMEVRRRMMVGGGGKMGMGDLEIPFRVSREVKMLLQERRERRDFDFAHGLRIRLRRQ